MDLVIIRVGYDCAKGLCVLKNAVILRSIDNADNSWFIFIYSIHDYTYNSSSYLVCENV